MKLNKSYAKKIEKLEQIIQNLLLNINSIKISYEGKLKSY